MILAGIDEAGYGPTLGPLVVAAAGFRVPDADEMPDLWKLLHRSTCRKPDGRRIPVNDSKKLYSTKKGLRPLEESVLAFLALHETRLPPDFRALVRRLAGTTAGDGYLDSYPWYQGRNRRLPHGAYPNQVRVAAEKLAEDLRASGVELLGVRALPMEVLQFNRGVDRLANKAQISFQIVGSLLKRLWRTFPGERIEVLVDRQGGRMHYGPLLYRRIRPRGLRILEESEGASSYDLFREGPPMRVTFAVESEERSFPVALASMFCKYLRELHMNLFNEFWAERVVDLKPTAGYHVDAQRFLEEIATARHELGVDDSALIRRR